MAKKAISVKEVIQSDNWIITKVLGGFDGLVRIDAKTRCHVADGQNFFSEWCLLKYANRLRREVGKPNLEITVF